MRVGGFSGEGAWTATLIWNCLFRWWWGQDLVFHWLTTFKHEEWWVASFAGDGILFEWFACLRVDIGPSGLCVCCLLVHLICRDVFTGNHWCSKSSIWWTRYVSQMCIYCLEKTLCQPSFSLASLHGHWWGYLQLLSPRDVLWGYLFFCNEEVIFWLGEWFLLALCGGCLSVIGKPHLALPPSCWAEILRDFARFRERVERV